MEKLYTIEQIKAYAHQWLKPVLCTDMMNSELENIRLAAFIHYIDKENDSDSIERFLQRKDWKKHVEWSNNI